MTRVPKGSLSLLVLALACGCGSSSSANGDADRRTVEHKPKPPVRVQTPEAPEGSPAYEPAAFVIWVGTDGIAVTDSLETSPDDKALLPLTGGRLMGSAAKTGPTRLPELLDAISARVEARRGAQPGNPPADESPIIAALVVDRRVGAQTLAAVQYTAMTAEVKAFDFVLDYEDSPKSVRQVTPSFGPVSKAVELELRAEASSLVVREEDQRTTVSLGEDSCSFSDPAQLDAVVSELCELASQRLDIVVFPEATTTMADLVAILGHRPRPEGCSGDWQVGSLHERAAPRCGDAKPPKDAYGEASDGELVVREFGILGVMAEQDGRPGIDPFADAFADGEPELGGIGGLGLVDSSATDDNGVRARTKIVSNDDHLDESLVRRIIRVHQRELAKCAALHSVATGETIQLKAKIGSTGKVIFAFVVDDGGHADAATCMSAAAKKWKFPKPTEVNEVVFDVEIQ